MKRRRLFIWVLLSVFILLGCQSESTNTSLTTLEPTTENETTIIETTSEEPTETSSFLIVEDIEIDYETIQSVYTINDFSLDGIQLNVHLSDESMISVPLGEQYIRQDILNINEPGIYRLDVDYLSFHTSFEVEIIENYDIIDIVIESYNPYALISDFDISDILLTVNYENDTSDQIPLSFDMLNTLDTNKLFQEGLHEITVNYADLQTTFMIAMFVEYPTNQTFELSQEAAIFYEVMDLLENHHFTDPEQEALYKGALNGMIESLNDRYTIYYDHEDFERRQDGLSESYVGIGISIASIDNQLVISSVVSGGPAERAGLMVNDIIRYIRGVEVTKENMNDIIYTMYGELGQSLNIKIERAGVTELIEFEIEYETINIPSVESRTINEDGQVLGIVKVNSFGSQTADLFDDAIASLEAESVQGIVIDLRNNGGGYLNAVLQMMRVFLINDGRPILTIEAYANGFEIDSFWGTGTEKKAYEIVVLVNEGSASASEVFAIGMQEHGGYTVVGTSTFGKGLVQKSLPISEKPDDYLTVTYAKWFSPLGQWVDQNGGTNGVTPDIIVERNELESLWKIFLSNEEILTYDRVDPRLERIQVILNGMGYDLRTDGYFDIQTQAAIEDIQSLNDLPVNGDIDQATIQIINDWLDDYQANTDTQLDEAINQLKD
jgi:carboxyl-terminal processing protease